MEQYSFNIKPENYQPSNCADFSKIDTPINATLTYTDLNTRKQEVHNITRTEITDENGTNKFIYILPPPFVKN
jgi:hypothetical protein